MRTEDLMCFLQRMSKQLPADAKSVHSDLLLPRLTSEIFWNANNSICTLVGLCCTGLNPVQEEFVRNHFYRKALQRQEQGSWKIVSTICTTTPWTPYFVVKVLYEKKGPNAIYGNWIPRIAWCLSKVKWVNPYIPNTRPVKRVQRKRGYTDKGSLGSSVEAPGAKSYISPTDLRSSSTTFVDKVPQGHRANLIEDSRIRAKELLLNQNVTTAKERQEIEDEFLEILEFAEVEEDSEELNIEDWRKPVRAKALITEPWLNQSQKSPTFSPSPFSSSANAVQRLELEE